jgi:hypothetical protein
MAGAGYKLFATGDVLTAAQVNTYLQEQTVMVFANAAARTTALSGVLAEGMATYLKDTDALEIYSGSAWVGYGSGDLTAITAGTGISVTSGTGPIPTVAIDTATTVDTTTAQTLTNKTLTAPKISLGYTAKTDNYTVASGDQNYLFTMNAATAKTFSIPTDATFNFAIGTQIHFAWITGAGQPSIAASTPATTTILSTGATSTAPKLRVANSAATAIKLAANSWLVVGDIA